MMTRRIALVFSTALAALAAGLTLGLIVFPASTRAAAPASPYSWFAPLVDVERVIADRYVEEPDLDAMQIGAIDGMIESLHDPYTEFIPTEKVSEFDKQVRGRYVGIGAAVIMDNGAVTIVTPLDDSPAYHAGIMAGDVITAVDGEPVSGMPLQAVIELLTGEPGARVVVTVRRGEQALDIPIIRKQIVTRTLSGVRRSGEAWDFMLDRARGIGYARLSQFTASSPAELANAIETMRAQGLKGLILDLRFNPGGLFAAAVQIADMFLDDGLIVRTAGRAHEEQRINATSDTLAPDLPLALLLNRQSASASEVLAGALADNGRAIVVGTRSFGKGVMQNVIALPSGAGQLKITEQHYYGPSGRLIHRTDDSTEWGVDPTDGFYVSMSDAEYTEMLRIQRASTIIRDADAAPSAPPRTDPSWVETELADPQLAAAVRGMIGELDTGRWARASTETPAPAADLAEFGRMRDARERLLRDLSRIDRRLEALSSVAPEDDLPEPTAIVPEGADLTGGSVVLLDADGRTVSTLRVTGPGLERWLLDAPVEVAPDETPAPAGTP